MNHAEEIEALRATMRDEEAEFQASGWAAHGEVCETCGRADCYRLGHNKHAGSGPERHLSTERRADFQLERHSGVAPAPQPNESCAHDFQPEPQNPRMTLPWERCIKCRYLRPVAQPARTEDELRERVERWPTPEEERAHDIYKAVTTLRELAPELLSEKARAI